MRSYIYSTVFLIAVAFVVWSCSGDESSMSVSSSGSKHPMVDIVGKGGDRDVKSERIKKYLSDKYEKGGEKPFAKVIINYRGDESIHAVEIEGDFTPPGYVKRVDVDEDIRARSRAFLEEEKELLGLSDLENELEEIAYVGTIRIRGPEGPVRKYMRYYHTVEGVRI